MSRQLGSFATELSMTFPEVALRLVIAVVLFAMPCFLSSFADAATQITLDEGYEVRFDNGKFDTETFDMQISNIEVLKNGKSYWNADAILSKTSLLADGRTLIVKKLKIDNFVSSVDKLKARSIIVRNVTLDKYDHLLAGKIGSLFDHALNDAYLGMFDFWMPIGRGVEHDTFVQSIELTPVRRKTSPSGRSYFNRIGMRGVASIKRQKLYNQNKAPTAENIAREEFFSHLGLQNVEVAFDLENALIEDRGVMHSELVGNIDIKNHFSTDIRFDAEIPLPAFWKIMDNKDLNTVFFDEVGDEFAQSFLMSFLQSGATLSHASLSVRDYGTFERLLHLYAENSGQSLTAAVEDIRLIVDQAIKESIPNEELRVFSAISKFLDHGGQLRLSATPDAPVPFLLFASYLLMPEMAIKQLNVTIEHSN